MTDSCPNALGRALLGFLADNLPRVRGLSRHTVRSFRDALKLLLVFLERHLQRPAATLDFPDLSQRHLLAFLHHLETQRGNCAATRNPYTVTDPQGPASGSGRVHRGGGWAFIARGCRASFRLYDTPGYRSDYLGFRLLRME